MATGVKDLKVWQESVLLAGEATRAMRHASRRETKALTDQILLGAAAVPMAIADACSRYSTTEQRACYRAARRALLLLETQLAIARQAELISASTLVQLGSRVSVVARLLSGYLAYLERQLTEERAAQPRPRAEIASVS